MLSAYMKAIVYNSIDSAHSYNGRFTLHCCVCKIHMLLKALSARKRGALRSLQRLSDQAALTQSQHVGSQ